MTHSANILQTKQQPSFEGISMGLLAVILIYIVLQDLLTLREASSIQASFFARKVIGHRLRNQYKEVRVGSRKGTKFRSTMIGSRLGPSEQEST